MGAQRAAPRGAEATDVTHPKTSEEDAEASAQNKRSAPQNPR